MWAPQPSVLKHQGLLLCNIASAAWLLLLLLVLKEMQFTPHLYEWLPKYCLLSASSCLLQSNLRRHWESRMPSLLAQSTKPACTPTCSTTDKTRVQSRLGCAGGEQLRESFSLDEAFCQTNGLFGSPFLGYKAACKGC